MSFRIIHGEALEILRTLPAESVHCCVTSPPYWGLRDYGVEGQLGLEPTPEAFVTRLVAILSEVRRVLRDDGTLWLNLGDSYATGAGSARVAGGNVFGKANGIVDSGDFPACQPNRMPIPGLKPKDLVGIPWRVAFALQADGWYLRSDIIWAKPAPMPESVTDRPTRSHEYIFLLAKNEKYYCDMGSIKEPSIYPDDNRKARQIAVDYQERAVEGRISTINPKNACTYPERNKRDVWTVNTKPFLEAHFATFPEDLIRPCILAGCPEGGTVLDPFAGACTTGLVSEKWWRNSILIELNADYCEMGRRRLDNFQPLLRGLEVEAVAP